MNGPSLTHFLFGNRENISAEELLVLVNSWRTTFLGELLFWVYSWRTTYWQNNIPDQETWDYKHSHNITNAYSHHTATMCSPLTSSGCVCNNNTIHKKKRVILTQQSLSFLVSITSTSHGKNFLNIELCEYRSLSVFGYTEFLLPVSSVHIRCGHDICHCFLQSTVGQTKF